MYKLLALLNCLAYIDHAAINGGAGTGSRRRGSNSPKEVGLSFPDPLHPGTLRGVGADQCRPAGSNW